MIFFTFLLCLSINALNLYFFIYRIHKSPSQNQDRNTNNYNRLKNYRLVSATAHHPANISLLFNSCNDTMFSILDSTIFKQLNENILQSNLLHVETVWSLGARTPEASAAPSNRFRLGAARTTSTQEQQCLHAICGGGGGERGERLGRHGGGSDCRGRPAAADASPATTPSPLTADCCSVLHTRPALASNEAHGATTTSDLDTHTHTRTESSSNTGTSTCAVLGLCEPPPESNKN